MSEQEFIVALKDLNIEIDALAMQKLAKYYELLVAWNEKINLTAITKKEDVYLKHFYDSLTIAKVINLNEVQTFCDVGSGAGFPGLVLKIVFPHLHVTLVDSLNKRTDFLKLVIKELALTNIEVETKRAEEYHKREYFDFVTARAVANLHILLELLVPLSKKYVILLKGDASEELEHTTNLYHELNIDLEQKEEFILPKEGSKRTILKYLKKQPTKIKYPRLYSQIKKKPL